MDDPTPLLDEEGRFWEAVDKIRVRLALGRFLEQMSDHCEVCGKPLPRPEGEPPPTTELLPGDYDMCIVEHRLTWWQRWRRARRENR